MQNTIKKYVIYYAVTPIFGGFGGVIGGNGKSPQTYCLRALAVVLVLGCFDISGYFFRRGDVPE